MATQITPLPAVPSRSSSPETFSDDADAFLGGLPLFRNELNAFGTQMETARDTAVTKAGEAVSSANAANTSKLAAAGSATTATTKAGEAAGSATTATTKAGEAVGSATTASTKATESANSAILSMNWAIKTDAPVSAGKYGSLYYAQQAEYWAGIAEAITDAAYFLDRRNHTHTQPINTIDGLNDALADKLSQATGGVLNGNLQVKTFTQGVLTTSGSSSINLNLSLADVFEVTITGDAAISFQFPPTVGLYKNILVILKQDGVGNRTPTFTGAQYTDGVLPAYTLTPNAKDVLSFFTYDGGLTYFGSFVMADVK